MQQACDTRPLYIFLPQTFSKPLFLCDSPFSIRRERGGGGVIQPGSPEHPFWSCSEEHGLGNLCSAESRLQRGERGRGYTGERGCNGEWQRERAGDMKEKGEKTETRQRMMGRGGFCCCFGVRLGMGSCFCHLKRKGEGERERNAHEKQIEMWRGQQKDQEKRLSSRGVLWCRSPVLWAGLTHAQDIVACMGKLIVQPKNEILSGCTII